jgi:hypothetical protein
MDFTKNSPQRQDEHEVNQQLSVGRTIMRAKVKRWASLVYYTQIRRAQRALLGWFKPLPNMSKHMFSIFRDNFNSLDGLQSFFRLLLP